MKKIIKKIGIGIMVIVGLGLFAGCVWGRRSPPCPSIAYEQRFGITLPENMEVLFHFSNVGWFGDGSRYTVFQLQEQLSEKDFFVMFDGALEPSHGQLRNETEFIRSFNRHVLNSIYHQIPQKFLPDWEQVFFWGPDTLLLLWVVYFPYDMRLVVSSHRI